MSWEEAAALPRKCLSLASAHLRPGTWAQPYGDIALTLWKHLPRFLSANRPALPAPLPRGAQVTRVTEVWFAAQPFPPRRLLFVPRAAFSRLIRQSQQILKLKPGTDDA